MNNQNGTERAATVLQQIDAALALSEKATPGPWASSPSGMAVENTGDYLFAYGKPDNHENRHANIRFIAASRTGWPTSLRCLKTAIEGLLHTAGYGDPNSCHRAFSALTTLCDQWEAGQ